MTNKTRIYSSALNDLFWRIFIIGKRLNSFKLLLTKSNEIQKYISANEETHITSTHMTRYDIWMSEEDTTSMKNEENVPYHTNN